MTDNSKNYSPKEIYQALSIISSSGIPGHGHAGIIDVGSDRYLEYFRTELIEDYIAQGGSTCRFFEGDYGTGKTHIIDLLHALCLENNMAVARTELSSSLSLEDWKQITKYILENIEIKLDGQNAKSLPNIIRLLGRNGRFDLQNLSDIPLPHSGFKKAMLYMANGNLNSEADDILTKFLLGNRLPLAYLSKYGVSGVKEPLSQRNSESVFRTVTNFLGKAGLKGTILLFDENEKTLTWHRGATPPKRVVDAANLMRRLVDATSNRGLEGVVVVFTVLPGFIDRATKAYRALGQRLQVDNRSDNQPWRCTVLQNASINSYIHRQDFLDAIADKLSMLLRESGVDKDIKDELKRLGEKVLHTRAGEEYKRELLKTMSNLCFQYIEGDV